MQYHPLCIPRKVLDFPSLISSITSMYGSYKIMQDHLYIFPRKFLDFQHIILKLHYCLDLTRLCKISCAFFQENSWNSMHVLETFYCVDLTRKCKIFCASSKKNLVFTSMILKFYCTIVWILQMQDLLCIFQEKSCIYKNDLETLLL